MLSIKDGCSASEDINSSYPHSMKRNIPVGQLTFVQGSQLTLDDYNIFGFYECFIDTTNINSNITPILPVRVNDSIITPIGSWKGWYFTEQLRKAIK